VKVPRQSAAATMAEAEARAKAEAEGRIIAEQQVLHFAAKHTTTSCLPLPCINWLIVLIIDVIL
jgi:hypothetical protein